MVMISAILSPMVDHFMEYFFAPQLLYLVGNAVLNKCTVVKLSNIVCSSIANSTMFIVN
jgi:hypothetical protein